MRSFKLAALLVSIVGSASVAQESKPPGYDRDAGVLCAWWYYSVIKAVGDHCLPDEQTEFKSIVSESVAKIEAFILTNAPSPHQQLDELRTEFRSGMAKFPGDFCGTSLVGNKITLYRSFERQGATAIRESIAKLLAIPHNPVMGECL